jgi:hypothetical protein
MHAAFQHRWIMKGRASERQIKKGRERKEKGMIER